MTEPTTAAGRTFYHGNAVKGFEQKLLRDILAIEAEARQDGSALRTALENLLTCPHEENDCQNWNEAHAALAALPPSAPPALDVERLAQALNNTDHADCLGWENPKAGCRGFYRRTAKAASAEYARLQEGAE